MKLKFILATGLAAALGIGLLSARTWTSADGAKKFEGDFKSYDAEAEKVTVIMRNGRNVTFALDKLSEADREFVKEQKAGGGDAGADVGEALKDQKIGSKVNRVLEKFDGKKFAKYELEKAPEFYFVYFSASW